MAKVDQAHKEKAPGIFAEGLKFRFTHALTR